MANSADLERLTGEVIQLGTVASVDPAAATCTVEIGDLITGDLPWIAPRAGAVRVWSPPSIGEQCIVLSPEGDLANGLVLPGLWSNANPAPSSDPAVVHLAFPDGAVMAYNHATHALAITLPAQGSAAIDAPAGIVLNANVTINGTLQASGDVTAAGISLQGHKHSGVQAGGAQTGAPA